MAYDEHLAQRLRAVIGSAPTITERKMFGGLCIMENRHMLVGVVGSELMVRVGPEQHVDALRQPFARPMDFTGRTMKGMVFVEPAGLSTDAAIAQWVERAHRFVSTLPPKP